MPAETGPILIGETAISPLQYRYLFPDLARLPESDEAIARHYAQAGRQEIESRRRVAHPDRLRAIQLQRLSPHALAAGPPSPNWHLVPGSSGTLDVFFSHGAQAEGAFEPSVAGTQSPHTRLYLKGEFHGFFQRGIPGLTGSIEETAAWIEAVIRIVKPTRLRLIGFSAAAYAAILFGHLLAADAIYAFAPEVLLGLPQYRSARWFPAGFHPVYRDLRPLLPALRDRLAILYPAYEPIEFRMLRWVLDAGVENVALGVDFHPGGLAVALDRVMAAEETPIAATSLTRVLHPGRYDFAAIERIATAYETWMEGDIALAETLLRAALADDPRNYGFMCHLAVHRGLQGDLAATEALLRTALEGMVGDYGPYGREVARHAKSVLRGFYEPSREQLRAIEPIFDRLSLAVAEGAAAAPDGRE